MVIGNTLWFLTGVCSNMFACILEKSSFECHFPDGYTKSATLGNSGILNTVISLQKCSFVAACHHSAAQMLTLASC